MIRYSSLTVVCRFWCNAKSSIYGQSLSFLSEILERDSTNLEQESTGSSPRVLVINLPSTSSTTH